MDFSQKLINCATQLFDRLECIELPQSKKQWKLTFIFWWLPSQSHPAFPSSWLIRLKVFAKNIALWVDYEYLSLVQLSFHMTSCEWMKNSFFLLILKESDTAEKFLLSNFFWSIPPPFEHILLHIHYKMCSKGGVMDQKKFESKNLSAVPLRMIRPRDSSTLN